MDNQNTRVLRRYESGTVVLILVLMDNQNTFVEKAETNFKPSLNPCSNG